MKTIKGDLILTEDFRIDDDLKVNGNIICKGGRWNIICYNIDCDNLNCNNIDCDNLNCNNIDCRNLDCDNVVCYNIDCDNLNCNNIDCDNLNCNNIDCDNLNCYNIDCRNLDCINLNCFDISFYDFCIAYYSFKCISAKARRKNFVLKCLDGEIEYKGEGK